MSRTPDEFIEEELEWGAKPRKHVRKFVSWKEHKAMREKMEQSQRCPIRRRNKDNFPLMTAFLLLLPMVVGAQDATNHKHLAAATCSAARVSLRWQALGLLESSNRDDVRHTNHNGTVDLGRYQINERVWRATVPGWPLQLSINSDCEQAVAFAIMLPREHHFFVVNDRKPTASEWALLWHAPAHVLHPNAEEQKYQSRFAKILCRLTK